MSKSYKALKEDFVSNLTGGDINEINYVTAVAPVALLLWSVLQSRQGFFLQYGVAAFLVDFLLNVIAILLAITLYSGASLLLSALLFTPVCLLLLTPKTRLKRNPLPSKLQQEKHQHDEVERLNPLPIRPFVTMYRGCMMIVTCLAILAVDFKIFPRRFAKTENWGTSLMDMGVGSFVFSAGVVGARAILQERLAKKSVPLASRLSASVKHSLPLFVLGLVRLWSVKGLDYAEHITEYGVHWNFFFTLALLPPFVALFQTFFAMIPSYTVLALLLGSAYQASLEFTPLKAYILTAQRTDLLSKNREGIFSFIGYLAIYLAGQATGLYILPRNANSTSSPNNSNIATQERKRMVIRLASWSITWALLLYLTLSYKYGLALRISRRLANLPYVLWVCAFNSSQILAFCLIETFIFTDVHKATDNRAAESEASKATSRILKSYNRNGLAIFLVANLLTGFINMTIKTLDLSTAEATAILIGYALILTVFAFGLDAKGISIKF